MIPEIPVRTTISAHGPFCSLAVFVRVQRRERGRKGSLSIEKVSIFLPVTYKRLFLRLVNADLSNLVNKMPSLQDSILVIYLRVYNTVHSRKVQIPKSDWLYT